MQDGLHGRNSSRSSWRKPEVTTAQFVSPNLNCDIFRSTIECRLKSRVNLLESNSPPTSCWFVAPAIVRSHGPANTVQTGVRRTMNQFAVRVTGPRPMIIRMSPCVWFDGSMSPGLNQKCGIMSIFENWPHTPNRRCRNLLKMLCEALFQNSKVQMGCHNQVPKHDLIS